ncbi:hypothetical protein D3C86_1182360 [compost metagenome]
MVVKTKGLVSSTTVFFEITELPPLKIKVASRSVADANTVLLVKIKLSVFTPTSTVEFLR